MSWLRDRLPLAFFATSAALLVAGIVAQFARAQGLAHGLWVTGCVLGLVVSVATTARAVRDRQPTVDVIAVLALAGALWVDEPFAGTMVAVMGTSTCHLLLGRRAAMVEGMCGVVEDGILP